MKTVAVRQLPQRIKSCLDEAQEDRVVITRHGKPAAILIGVEGKDWETVMLETNLTFWRVVQARRGQPTITLAELKARLKPKS